MILPDVNVLVAAFREDHVHHAGALAFLTDAHAKRELVAFCDVTLTGLTRLATHPRVFSPASSLDDVFDFIEDLRALSGAISLSAGPDHWNLFEALCRKSGAVGGLVTDAYLAALALEHGCVVATFDKDFKRFPGLRTVRPG